MSEQDRTSAPTDNGDPFEHAPMDRLRAYMMLCFVGYTVFLFAMGVRFDVSPLETFAHYADPELLRTRLFETCLHLHIQPPLYNLAIGIVLKLFSGFHAPVFYAIFIATGLALSLMLFALMVRLGVSKKLSFVLTLLFVCSPSFVLYEHLLLYTLHCAALLVAAALLLHVFLSEKRAWAGWGFFAALFLLGGIQPMYHLVYYLAIAAGLLIHLRPFRRRHLAMALLPGLLLFSFYLKNYVLFGQFTTMSSFGKGPWIKTVGNLPWKERVRLAEEGKISAVSLVDRSWAIDFYPPEIREVKGYENIPALREKNKSTGEVNHNHLSQIRISKCYLQDAMYAIRHYPRTFLCSTAWAALAFYSPNHVGVPSLDWLNALYDRVVYGKINVPLSQYLPWLGASKHVPYVFLLIGWPALFVYGAWRARRGGGAERGVLLFMLFTIFHVTASGILFGLTEANRDRFEIDSFHIVLLAVFLQSVVLPWWQRVMQPVDIPESPDVVQ
ncbi:MAG TPA: hypothetical protein PK967_03615 [Candidatus Hydrogenedentes bacterium]|nr:hypothetical protein [Candidatus Hydrogenedentota bacterium]